MTFYELTDYAQMGLVGLVIILLGLIRIPRVDLNIWSLIAKGVGKALNRDIAERLDKLTKDFEHHLVVEEEDKIREARRYILRFNDEILYNRRHSKEHFDEILDYIDIYEEYCNLHPNYKNNKAMIAIDTIKKTYDYCLKTHDFLAADKQEVVKW